MRWTVKSRASRRPAANHPRPQPRAQIRERSQVDGISAGGVPITTAISLPLLSGMVFGSPLNFVPSTYTSVFAGSVTFHSVRNWPKVLNLRVDDSVWITPVASCVCRGEMHGVAHGGLIPPYAGYPPISPLCTAGFVVSMPMPPGTTICLPSWNTSRCAWTWNSRCSEVSGTRPAATVRAIGSGGAGHWIFCPAGGSGADAFDDDDEHA